MSESQAIEESDYPVTKKNLIDQLRKGVDFAVGWFEDNSFRLCYRPGTGIHITKKP